MPVRRGSICALNGNARDCNKSSTLLLTLTRLSLRSCLCADTKKNDCFTSRWKSIGKRERKFYYFLIIFCFSFSFLCLVLYFLLFSYLLFDYALNVLKLDSTFFEITFLTASISVEIAFSSVSNCFNFNSKFLSWDWIISIFELISWISLSYWFLL